MQNNTVSTDVFNLIPGLVLDYLGQPGIVMPNILRDHGTEMITFELNTPDRFVTVTRSWGNGDRVNVIGLAVDCEPGNIDLFNS